MGMELDVGHALLLAAADGETISDNEARNVLILVDEPQLVMTWTRYEHGERGPDPHVHRKHTDGFYIVEGEIEFGLGPGGEHVVQAPAGSVVIAPPNVVHTFANVSGARAVYLNFHAPNGGFADFLRALRDDREFKWDSWDEPADGGRPVSDAVVCLPGEGERFERGDRTITILADTPELSLLELAVTPGWEGVDPHTHDDHLDGFFVLDGEIDFLAGKAHDGMVMAAPPGAEHGLHRPTGDTRLLNFHAPETGFAERIRAQ
jgi:quercetin dioxygenase-like cupin family protein